MSATLPYSFAKQHGVVLPLAYAADKRVWHHAPVSLETLLAVQRYVGSAVTWEQVSLEVFQAELARVYEGSPSGALQAMESLEEAHDLKALMSELPITEDLLESEDDAPIIKLLNAVLSQAIQQKASDIHVETFEDRVSLRFRVDGVLHEELQPPRVLAPLLISRLKVMAKLDIAEKRLPQDGRISLRIAGRAVDVRVSTLPTHYGERVVLRLLDKQNAPLDLGRLGMSSATLSWMRRLIARPHGILLVTGPTGSGKTTTLYAALTELNHVSRNILTVEDPIEYYLAGIGQTQVNSKIDMSFARGLRAILRQDPDVVMVGEIRDLETADMAVQASLTGHLVLSTLHTNSAIGAITRLRDMGVEPFLLSSCLLGVVAQRLIRLLCPACKVPYVASDALCHTLGVTTAAPLTLYQAQGCEHCKQTGYAGRVGIYELIAIQEELRAAIHAERGEAEMEAMFRPSFPSIRQDGWRCVIDGLTSVEEVLRVTSEA